MASIALDPGSAPGGMVAGAGSLWVSSHRQDTLYRIKPSDDRVVARVDLGQEACGIPVFGAHRVYVSPCDGSSDTSVVDATTNKIAGHIAGTAAGGGAWFAFGSVWLTAQDTRHVIRVDPVTLKRLAIFAIPSVDIVNDERTMWFAETNSDGNYTGRLDQVDPTTNRIVRRLRTTKTNAGSDPYLAYTHSTLWLKGNDKPTLVAISTTTGKLVTYKLPGWSQLSRYYDQPPIASGNALWIRIADDRVVRFDAARRRVTGTYPADTDGGGGYPVMAFGSLWVANFASDTVWKDRVV